MESQRRQKRRAHEPASALPTTGITLVGYLTAISPVLQLQASKGQRQAFYAHVADAPPGSTDGRTASVDTVTVLFDNASAAVRTRQRVSPPPLASPQYTPAACDVQDSL